MSRRTKNKGVSHAGIIKAAIELKRLIAALLFCFFRLSFLMRIFA